jgi:hypothetical protein
MQKKLSDCKAEIRSCKWEEGVVTDTLWFSWDDEWHIIPFRPEGGHIDAPSGKKRNVWTHVSGTTIEDLTLAPSYSCTAPESHLLHCFIRNGNVVVC